MAGGGSRWRRAGALAALGLGLATAAAGEDEGAADAPAAYEAADPGDRRSRSADPGERSGRTSDPGEHAAETREPSFGGRTVDLGERPGASRALRDVSRPPGPKPAPADGETGGPADLRLHRRPGEGAGREAPLPERYCSAEADLEHARRERERALRDYKRMRRDGYPRGPAKALLLERRDLSARSLRRAEAARTALLAEAGEEGMELDPTACGGDAP